MPTPRQIVLDELWNDDITPMSAGAPHQPDRRDGSVYHLTPELKIAIKVALVTFRPLLLRGDPGTGKSSLASYLARNLGWRYYEHVVTARTEARDLIYSFDAVRRLADSHGQTETVVPSSRRPRSLFARAGDNLTGSGDVASTPEGPGRHRVDPAHYVNPGVLWWAVHRDSAARRGLESQVRDGPIEPNATLNKDRSPHHAVVLIDEIDKADPDVPNNLLVALGSNVFQIAETGHDITAAPHPDGDRTLSNLLVVITTNEERDLPRAFLRRCVIHELRLPAEEEALVRYLTAVAALHRQRDGVTTSDSEISRAEAVARVLFRFRADAIRQQLRPPGTAEFLDAIRACRELRVDPSKDNPTWQLVERATLVKHS